MLKIYLADLRKRLKKRAQERFGSDKTRYLIGIDLFVY